jgi:GABA(A) receptor-associated protein
MNRYPGRCPIIMQPMNVKGPKIPQISKCKYLVPRDITFGKFIYEIRKYIELKPQEALFVFVGDNSIVASTATVS